VDVVVALDAGTTGVRAVVFDQRATTVDSEYRELTQHFPRPGEVEHDVTEIGALATSTLRAVGARARDRGDRVVALGITNQRETTIAFDRSSGLASHRAIVWQDRRTAPECERLTAEGHEAIVRASTGLVLDPYFSATKMRWLLDRGVLDGATAPALATVDAYLIWLLTGGTRGGSLLTEPSNASRTMLMDLAGAAWSEDMSQLFGVPTQLLPEIRPSGWAFGQVSAEAVPELVGVPIAGVLGDQQAALFGQCCFDAGMVKATYGTGAFLLVNVGAHPPPPRDGLVGTVAWSLDGEVTYALEGSSFVAGAAIQWLRDELGIIESSRDLEPLAREVDDTGGVSFVPAFVGLGSPFWRSGARGAIVGITPGTTRAHIARAVLEAQVHQVRAMTEAFAAAGITLSELRADGGAAAMDLMLALQATSSRVVVRRSGTLEATARGAATLAGLTVGLWGSLDELADAWTASGEFVPGEPSAVDASYAAWTRAVERS
jgi:glycerol kinase